MTTRQKRPSEIAGKHYHFITVPQFERMRDAGDLLEWAEVHGNYYGTPREPVEQAMAEMADSAAEFPEVAVFRDSILASTRGITR